MKGPDLKASVSFRIQTLYDKGNRRQPRLSCSYISLHETTTFSHNRVIYTVLWLPETKGNDFPVFFRINNFRLYGGGPRCVLTVKYFIPQTHPLSYPIFPSFRSRNTCLFTTW